MFLNLALLCLVMPYFFSIFYLSSLSCSWYLSSLSLYSSILSELSQSCEQRSFSLSNSFSSFFFSFSPSFSQSFLMSLLMSAEGRLGFSLWYWGYLFCTYRWQGAIGFFLWVSRFHSSQSELRSLVLMSNILVQQSLLVVDMALHSSVICLVRFFQSGLPFDRSSHDRSKKNLMQAFIGFEGGGQCRPNSSSRARLHSSKLSSSLFI